MGEIKIKFDNTSIKRIFLNYIFKFLDSLVVPMEMKKIATFFINFIHVVYEQDFGLELVGVVEIHV